VTCELTVTDCLGNTVELHHTNWQRHLGRHPEMAAYHALVARTLEAPDQVVADPRAPGEAHFYRRDRGAGRTTQRLLRVVVTYNTRGGPGAVKTAHFVRAIQPKGRVLWKR
jgi:hypothetical protein